MSTVYGQHFYAADDDCMRCIYCCRLPGAVDPCEANVVTEQEERA